MGKVPKWFGWFGIGDSIRASWKFIGAVVTGALAIVFAVSEKKGPTLTFVWVLVAIAIGLLVAHMGLDLWDKVAPRLRKIAEKKRTKEVLADSVETNKTMAAMSQGLADLLASKEWEVADLRKRVAAGSDDKRAALADAEASAALAQRVQADFRKLADRFARAMANAALSNHMLMRIEGVLIGPSAPFWKGISAQEQPPKELLPLEERVAHAHRLLGSYYKQRDVLVGQLIQVIAEVMDDAYGPHPGRLTFKPPPQLGPPLDPDSGEHPSL